MPDLLPRRRRRCNDPAPEIVRIRTTEGIEHRLLNISYGLRGKQLIRNGWKRVGRGQGARPYFSTWDPRVAEEEARDLGLHIREV